MIRVNIRSFHSFHWSGRFIDQRQRNLRSRVMRATDIAVASSTATKRIDLKPLLRMGMTSRPGGSAHSPLHTRCPLGHPVKNGRPSVFKVEPVPSVRSAAVVTTATSSGTISEAKIARLEYAPVAVVITAFARATGTPRRRRRRHERNHARLRGRAGSDAHASRRWSASPPVFDGGPHPTLPRHWPPNRPPHCGSAARSRR